RAARMVAQLTCRRSFVGRLGTLLMTGGALPLLPVARAAAAPAGGADEQSRATPGPPGLPQQYGLGPDEEGDPASCDYWRYCGLSGHTCACCGGSANACPP